MKYLWILLESASFAKKSQVSTISSNLFSLFPMLHYVSSSIFSLKAPKIQKILTLSKEDCPRQWLGIHLRLSEPYHEAFSVMRHQCTQRLQWLYYLKSLNDHEWVLYLGFHCLGSVIGVLTEVLVLAMVLETVMASIWLFEAAVFGEISVRPAPDVPDSKLVRPAKPKLVVSLLFHTRAGLAWALVAKGKKGLICNRKTCVQCGKTRNLLSLENIS